MGGLKTVGLTYSLRLDSLNYISNHPSLNTVSGYETVILPLTLELKYGTYLISDIYEEYENYPAENLDIADLIDIIDEAIGYYYSSTPFLDIYRQMETYLCNASSFYSGVGFGSIGNGVDLHEISIITNENINVVQSVSIPALSSKYYKIQLSSKTLKADVNIRIPFNVSGGAVQWYTVNENNIPSAIIGDTGDRNMTFSNLGGDITELIVVISNVNTTNTTVIGQINVSITPITYDFDIENINNGRYAEKRVYLAPGQSVEFRMSRSMFSIMILQTFGDKGTTLQVYNNYGGLEESDSGSGYTSNAFIAHQFIMDEIYYVKLFFANSSHFGYVRFGATSALGMPAASTGGIQDYYDIRCIEDVPESFSGYTEQYYNQVLLFVPPTNGNYTISLTSDFDNYLYVIDPFLSTTIESGVHYNDDSNGLNASITTYFYSATEYFIILSAYNPQTVESFQNITVNITAA